MSVQRARIDSRSLLVRRTALGLTQEDVADAIGVESDAIRQYEEGRAAPGAECLHRLAAVLYCEVEDLLESSGVETLADLRRSAALSLEAASERLLELDLRGRLPDAMALQRLEDGNEPDEQRQVDAKDSGELVRALAEVYDVPVRMLLDAWMRSRPAEAAPELPDEDAAGVSAAAGHTWEGLNDRQKAYLEEIFREDEAMAVDVRYARLTGEVPPPARVWRRLPLAVDDPDADQTRLQVRLVRRRIHDSGTGSTVHALARRGLLNVYEDEVDLPEGGTAPRVLVELTRRGRAAARAGVGPTESSRPAAHLLSEWLWGVLARVASAEPVGLPENELAGRALFFLGVGYRNRARGRPSRGLIDAVPVMAPGGTHVVEYRWRLTVLGRRHVAQYIDTYRHLYPRVDVADVGNPAPADG